MTPPAAPRSPLDPAVLILLSVVFVNLVGFGVVVPLLPFYAEAFGADPWQVTLMFAAFSLGQFFGEPTWGRLSDRIGRKPVLLFTVAVNAAGYLALAFAPNLWVAVLIRLVHGFGAGNISTVQGYIADVTPPAERAGRLGLIGAAFGLGFIVGPGMGGLLADETRGLAGFHPPLFTAAVLAALAALGVHLFVRETRARAEPDAVQATRRQSVAEAWGHPVVRRVLAVTLVYMAAFAGMEATFGLWAERKFEWGTAEVGLTLTVVGVVAALSQGLLTGRLVRRFGETRVLAAGLALFGVGLLAQSLHAQAWLIPVITGVIALGQSFAMPTISAQISKSTPPDRQGAMLGLNMATGALARLVGPMLAGVTFGALGPDAPLVTGALLAIPALLLALEAGAARRRMDARPQEP